MGSKIKTDLCVIGGGSGGLSVAAGAVQMGADTILIESGKMGGDCLNYGCVPSKSLIAAAASAHHFRHSPILGDGDAGYQADMKRVKNHIQSVIAHIEPHDSIERFEGLGVKVIQGHAEFRGQNLVGVNDIEIDAKWIVVATGSRPSAPPIDGLDGIDYETNETIFNNEVLPEHLLVIGGGAIGCELAQAYCRLGALVTIIDVGPILAKDDREMAQIVRDSLVAEGVVIHDRVKVVRAEPGPVIIIDRGEGEEHISGDRLLVAAGRKPNIGSLGLENAGIEFDRHGIQVDARLRTSNKSVFAIGDCAGGLQFTHVAGYQAGIVIRNALFRLPATASNKAIPWATYTSPELAHVGLSAAQAAEQGVSHEILNWSFKDNDRAVAESNTKGAIKVVADRRGRVLGATIVGSNAGELIFPWALAISQKMKLSALAGAVAPYPTRSEISKRVAGSYFTPKIFSNRVRKVVKLLLKLPF